MRGRRGRYVVTVAVLGLNESRSNTTLAWRGEERKGWQWTIFCTRDRYLQFWPILLVDGLTMLVLACRRAARLTPLHLAMLVRTNRLSQPRHGEHFSEIRA